MWIIVMYLKVTTIIGLGWLAIGALSPEFDRNAKKRIHRQYGRD